jgi:hypothetical protein
MIRNFLIFTLFSSLILSCKHGLSNDEKQRVAELTIKHHIDPMNRKKITDFHFKDFQANSDGSGYMIILLNDYMSKEDLYKNFSPQTEVFLNADCTKIVGLATE